MKDMLYYPGFEVQDKTWLKFALLYLDTIRPIIPYTSVPETEYLSDEFRFIMNETDLIRPYRPQYEEEVCASSLAIDEFEGYLRDPKRYNSYFGRSMAMRLPEKWKSAAYQNYTLFEGKYERVFYLFCIESGIASQCDEGIRISEDLAFVYMSLLADVISKNNEYEMMTDSKRYTALLLKNDIHMAKFTQRELQFAKNKIELAIPTNLQNIPIEQIVHLRKQRNFNELRKAYQNEIGRLIKNKENNLPGFSLAELLSYEKDFIKICEQSFAMVMAAILTVYTYTALRDGVQDAELVPAMASIFMDYKTAKDAAVEIPQFIEKLQTKRLARKYLTKIGKMGRGNK